MTEEDLYALLNRIDQLRKNTGAIRQQMSNVFENAKDVLNKGWGINIRTGILNKDKTADPALRHKYLAHLDSDQETLHRLTRLMPAILTDHQQRLKKIDSLLQSIHTPLTAAGKNREEVLVLLDDNYDRWRPAVQAGEELLALMQSDGAIMQQTVNQMREELSGFPDSDAGFVKEKDTRKEPSGHTLLIAQSQQLLKDVTKYFEELHKTLSGLYHAGLALINEIEPWFSKMRTDFPEEVSPALRDFILGMRDRFPPFLEKQKNFFDARDKNLKDWPDRLVNLQKEITQCRNNPKLVPADVLDIKNKLRKLLTEMEAATRQTSVYTKELQQMQKIWKDGAKWRG